MWALDGVDSGDERRRTLAYVDALILLTAALLLWVLRPDDEPVVDYEDGLRTMSSYHGARYDDGHDDQYQPPRYEVEQPTYDYPGTDRA